MRELKSWLREPLLADQQFAPMGLGYRATVVKALAFGASKVPQCCYMARQLNAFRDDIGVNRFGYDENRLNDRLGVRELVQLEDKALVDLDFVKKYSFR